MHSQIRRRIFQEKNWFEFKSKSNPNPNSIQLQKQQEVKKSVRSPIVQTNVSKSLPRKIHHVEYEKSIEKFRHILKLLTAHPKTHFPPQNTNTT